MEKPDLVIYRAGTLDHMMLTCDNMLSMCNWNSLETKHYSDYYFEPLWYSKLTEGKEVHVHLKTFAMSHKGIIVIVSKSHFNF